ncbi:hypothetical protein AKAW_10802 [Aspergillus luchuensis IFO 4308]|nr:hypothetical protein AKAW_10802 [Aspergillus luchuensis IFO 4308]
MKVTILSAILALSLSAHALSNDFVGCYSSSGSLVNKGSSEFQSTGLCTTLTATVALRCLRARSSSPSQSAISIAQDFQRTIIAAHVGGGNGFWSVHQTYITGDDVDGDDNNNTDDGDGNSDSGDNSGNGPNDGPGSGFGDGPDDGPGKGPGGGPETTTASSITIYPTPSAVITVTSAAAMTGTSSPSATIPSKESSSVSVATVSPTTATSGASRRFRFLFF